ncbi:hypothetical protein F5141DRAFT_112518 [Pisolithus sp. B1]|nr:hypothetical protein F5141DRAFT_112518 [Pisolithus sp. B1]
MLSMEQLQVRTRQTPDLVQTSDSIASTVGRCKRLQDHDNASQYCDCIRKVDYHFSGTCLKRYDRALCDEMSVREDEGKLDAERITEITQAFALSGLEYLRRFGCAHNDVTPTDVIVDEDAGPVFIDFRSCRHLGDVTEVRNRVDAGVRFHVKIGGI